MLKKYKVGFDVWALALFLAVMVPNFIWFAVPAPNDVLRAESATRVPDAIASVCQAGFVLALCLLIRRNIEKVKFSPVIAAVLFGVLLYFVGWLLYYSGNASTIVILLLMVSPCLAFLLYAADRKNVIALLLIIIFSVCHFIYGIVNFIILP